MAEYWIRAKAEVYVTAVVEADTGYEAEAILEEKFLTIMCDTRDVYDFETVRILEQ